LEALKFRARKTIECGYAGTLCIEDRNPENRSSVTLLSKLPAQCQVTHVLLFFSVSSPSKGPFSRRILSGFLDDESRVALGSKTLVGTVRPGTRLPAKCQKRYEWMLITKRPNKRWERLDE